MKPIVTENTPLVLGAPEGWNSERHGECRGLPVERGDGFLCSYWQTSWRERLALLFGRPLRLSVAVDVDRHPPVWLDTEAA